VQSGGSGGAPSETSTVDDGGGVGSFDVKAHTGGQVAVSSLSTATGGRTPDATGGNAPTGGRAPDATGGSAPTGGRAPDATGGSAPTGGRPSNPTGGSVSTGGRPSTGGSPPGGSSNANGVSAIDILYMIDNSSSMADKQQVLASSLPQLLTQLVQPNCVNDANQILGRSQMTASGATCASGTLEFQPINDIHLGVVSSSLGDHGANTFCNPGASTNYTDSSGKVIVQPPDLNDMGRLLGTLTRGAQALQSDSSIVPSSVFKLDSQGFLAWNSGTNVPTVADVASGAAAFKDMVVATGQIGCGYESQLESWFRFLVDPVPPQYPLGAPDNNVTQRTGVDDALLAQRAAFLRPNSLVLIVMLTDENDCSIRDTDVGWVVASTSLGSITTGSPDCAVNPNDKCCYSCTAGAPTGCAPCASPGSAADDGAYQANIRCYNQKRRFGYDFLYPTSRYYVALTHKELCPDQSTGDMDCDCTRAKAIGASCSPGSRRLPNPLFSQTVGTDSKNNPVMSAVSAAPRSDTSNVFIAGILGVPWQDVSEPSSQGASAALTYIPVTDTRWTAANGIWTQIYGDDELNITPADMHMVESLVPRAGLSGPTTASPTDDPKTGHEYNTAREDLEYACTFALEGAAPARGCVCDVNDSLYATCKYQNPNDCCELSYRADGAGGPGDNFDKPLCQNPKTGAYETKQYFAKAYPGLREIAVLHDYAVGPSTYTDLGGTGNSIVTSICPKTLTAGQEATPGYGYNPIAQAMIERIKVRLKH
jgi:hypothetical protein